tara:strand:- start:3167 stop:3319 length:153 start_codon:yes stop_codon:yes gene_type:complete
MKWTFKEIITSEKELREIMGEPSELVTRKTLDYIDENSFFSVRTQGPWNK